MKFSGNITEKMMRSVGKSKNRAKSYKGHWSYELTALRLVGFALSTITPLYVSLFHSL